MKPILHSKIIGKGKPLCILHGFLGMSDNWKSIGNKYAEAGYEVHLIDQRNHGKSFWSDVFDYKELSEDLERYVSNHELASIDLIGHSMGGKTAMEFSCTYPPLVDKLIVADIAPKYYPPHHAHILDALGALNLVEISSRNEANEKLAAHLDDLGTRQFLLKNLYWKEKGQLAFRFNLEVLKTKMEEIGATLNPGSQFNGPTLFLRGSKSDYIKDEDFDRIKTHFPNAELDTIADAGHWVHAENPSIFFDKSIHFLKGQ